MPEKPSHRRAKTKAAGPGGQTEVPLPGGKRLDARTQGGGRATEVERSGSSQGLETAARRLKQSGAPQKVLQVPQKDILGQPRLFAAFTYPLSNRAHEAIM